ncbi:MAG TPA: hypothetical protein VF571_17580 [Pyrinomonadaceae bacterium]|jgi:hypothetical protein
MGLLERFDTPAHMPDFIGLPGLLDQWHRAVSNWFDSMVKAQESKLKSGEVVQFFNPTKFDPGGAVIEQAITWNAFPKELLRRYGRQQALREADTLYPLSRYAARYQQNPVFERTPFRPHNEYCEWHVTRDPETNKIKKVAFSSEPPEYWKALHGGTYKLDDDQEYTFTGSPERVLELYRKHVSPNVQPDDLISTEDMQDADGNYLVRKGEYNPYNKWNTSQGIMHLCSPPNTLVAEIGLGAEATILRKNSRGQLIVEPDALICCAAYGGPDRNSDPTIGAAVNALARYGAFVTLGNPVGLYIDHIDLAGWSVPDKGEVSDCVKFTRGSSGMVERLEVEVPASRDFTVSDIKIGGIPIMYGGQIAECITVKLVGVAHVNELQNKIKETNKPKECEARCCIDANHALVLERPVRKNLPLPLGKQTAFLNQGAYGLPDGEPDAELKELDGSLSAKTSAMAEPPGEESSEKTTKPRIYSRIP